MLKKAIL
jgi:hypothetical protein